MRCLSWKTISIFSAFDISLSRPVSSIARRCLLIYFSFSIRIVRAARSGGSDACGWCSQKRLIGNACHSMRMYLEYIYAWFIKLTACNLAQPKRAASSPNGCHRPKYVSGHGKKAVDGGSAQNKLNVTVDGMPFVCCTEIASGKRYGHANVKFAS